MEDPTLIVAAAGPLTAAIFFIGSWLRERRNNKNNNPGPLHEIHLTLTRIEERLKSMNGKLDELRRR